MYSCDFCDKSFHLLTHLSNHLTEHTGEFPYTCDKCPQSFTLQSHLSNHIVTNHHPLVSLTASLSCFKCALSFEQFCDLSEHIKSFHDPSLFYPCEECELAFPTRSYLETHILSDHKTPLFQFDGPIQDSFDFNDFSPIKTVRSATYNLNKAKQMNDIQKDASIQDFNITVNNSDQNATIKCSAGFYTQVAMPSFSTLAKRSVFTKSKVAITVDEVTITKEMGGLESNRLMHFSFMAEQKSYGGVAVHLHHSTRTIQIQGSHVMPDSSRAAVWFVKNATITRFKEQAIAKKYEINAFNAAVKRLPLNNINISNDSNESVNSCQSCYSTFNTQSKPSRCDFCSKYFHKTNCLKDHMKTCSMSPKVISLSIYPGSTSSSTISTLVTPSSLTNLSPPTEISPQTSSDCLTLASPSSVSLPAYLQQSLSTPMPSLIPGLQTSVTFVPITTIDTSHGISHSAHITPSLDDGFPDPPIIAPPIQPQIPKKKSTFKSLHHHLPTLK